MSEIGRVCYRAGMKRTRRVLLLDGLILCAAVAAGCGDSGGAGSDSDGGVCGTLSSPGILKVARLSPAPGASVSNRNIVHSFTVVGAPAEYNTFDLIYGEGHTAGLSAPAYPKFKTTISGSDVEYQMVIEGWSHAPGHVTLNARGSFTTAQGCTWTFPAPLFSYDVTATPGIDGGMDGSSAEISVIADGGWTLPDVPVDLPAEAVAGLEVGSVVDAASDALEAEVELAPLDVAPAVDVGAVMDAERALDLPVGAGG